MRYCLPFLYATLLLSACHQQPNTPPTTLRLPITLKQGYGPFYPGFGLLDAEHIGDPVWGKTYYPISGIPRHWSNPTKTRLILDFQQFIVYAVRGFDEYLGKWAVLVDTNNNLDFSDEIPVYPTIIAAKEIPDKPKNLRTIRYEVYQNGRVRNAYAPITFRYSGGHFLYNFPQYAITHSVVNDRHYDFVIDPSLSRRDYEGSTIALASSVKSNGRVDEQKLIKVGDEIELGGVLYRNNGISPADNILELEPVDAVATRTNPLQNGHAFRPFTDTDFTSGKTIDLHHQQGKYVFIDFWHTGCKGCVEDMANLNALYQRVDKRKIEFIGINCGDTPERLRAFLLKKQVNWPQVLSTRQSEYYHTYRVSSFPTTVLLDPTGKIIARDMHSSALINKLAQLNL
jgi:thiol-disulfide isomerase/thioredoxin